MALIGALLPTRAEISQWKGTARMSSNLNTNIYSFKSSHELGSPQYIRQVLSLICEPGQVYELRCLKTRKGTISGYYDDLDRLAEDAAHLSGEVPNVYITANPCLRDLLARANNRCIFYAHNTTEDRYIIKRRWFLIDVDPVRPAGISSTDLEKEFAFNVIYEIRKHLSQQPRKGLFCDSGNGYHLMYRWEAPNDLASLHQWRNAIQVIAQQFDSEPGVADPKFEAAKPKVKIDTTVTNAARIWKLYGTLAAKGDSMPDRPHRYSRVLEVMA